MIRVCHLITGLEVGGAENTLVRTCRALAALGYHQLVIAMVPGGQLAEDLRCAGITVRSLGMRRGWPNPFSYIKLVRELRRFRADVLQTWMYHADLLGTMVRPFIPQARLLWNVRCSDMRGDRRLSLKWLVNSLALLSSIPQAIIVNSRAGWADHVNAGYRQSRCVFIPNGVDTDRFQPLPEERASLRAALGLPLEATLIGMIARVHPMKDHRTFLAAAAQFRENRPNAHFVLVGPGCDPGAAPLDTMIRELGLELHISMLGSRSDLPRIYPVLDLVCLSSAFGEGTPNVLLEALACGVPCVATDVGDCRSIIGQCGRVVPPREPSALAAAWDEVLRQDLGVSARSYAVTSFAESIAAAAYDKLYRNLLRCEGVTMTTGRSPG
jgi:glycosyltransferase involved in cell wall biosynthesis